MYYIIATFVVGCLLQCHVVVGGEVCQTGICKQIANELKNSMNVSVDPCEDFGSYICGNFGKTHPLPPGSSSVNSFTEIGDKVSKSLRDILENEPISAPYSPQAKAAIFYKSCMDTTQRNVASKPQIIEAIKHYANTTNYQDVLSAYVRKGITSRIASLQLSPDAKNPKYFQIQVSQPNFILSQATLKTPDSPNSKKQIESQIKYMKRVYDLLRLPKEDDAYYTAIIDFNSKIAQTLPSVAEQHDPDKYYNKMSLKDLDSLCPEIAWTEMINSIGSGQRLQESDLVLVSSLPYFGGMCKVLKTYLSDDKLKRVLFNDLMWAEVSSVITLASEDLLNATYDLAKDLFGISGKEEQWVTCVELTSSTFKDIVGNMYVKKEFDASKKKDIEDMLRNIRSSLRVVIEKVNWMDNDTKAKALIKLQTIKQKIGYSDSLLNETKLSLNHVEVKVGLDSFIRNFYSFKKAELKNSMKLYNKMIPDDYWFLGPHEVNAYYNPASNEIVFPAAILQYPFYDIGLPVTNNYGGVGMVIGHEILHGFDTSGSKFDETGILRNWWTTETKASYLDKTKCILHQYGNFSIYDEKLPSAQTLGEDIADNAGIRMSYFASQNSTKEKSTLPGLEFTAEQLFFVHEARTWCSHVTKEALLARMKQDVHTVWSYRINGPLSNMPEFSKAFNCDHDKKMNRHKKCLVW